MATQQIDPNTRFERERMRAKQETRAQTQAAQEALRRRFAASGLQSSGAAIKSEQLAEKAGQGALQRRLEGISSAQEQEALRKQEIEEARQFAKSEREAGQQFGAEQALLARQFASGEREAGQKFGAEQAGLQRAFAAEQAGLGREYGTQERIASQNFAKAQNEAQKSQFEQQMNFAKQQFKEDIRVTDFNMQQAIQAANQPSSMQKMLNQWKYLTPEGMVVGGLEDLGSQWSIN